MKRRWTITLLVILLAAVGVGLFKYWPRTIDDGQCSALYRSYLHCPGIQSTYIKGKRLNDTLRIDLTLDTLCVVKYAVADRTGQTVIHSQKEIDILLYQFLFDARNNGCSISMQANRTPRGAKLQFADTPVVTFQSSDVGKVKEWAKRMLLKGYRVEIVYDKKSKTYHCTARPKS